jgi:hypothetical protein
MITKQHIKAFFIALLSFKFSVTWGRRKRCFFKGFQYGQHPHMVKFLSYFYDVRRRPVDDTIMLFFRERARVRRRKMNKKIVRFVRSRM